MQVKIDFAKRNEKAMLLGDPSELQGRWSFIDCKPAGENPLL